jgi:hypothetical protein
MPPSEVVNGYGVSQHRVQPLSPHLSLEIALNVTGRERRTTCIQLDQQIKARVTKTQQD